jgi:LacI family transcriptional regulator
MPKRATMVDIALRAGVSQATVSLVLNDVANARVSPETRTRVKAAAAALGYTRRGGLTLAAGTRVIGMLIDEVTTTPLAAPFIDGARDAAAEQGAILALFCTGGDSTSEESALDVLAGTDLVGVVYTRLMTRGVTPPERLFAMNAVLLNCHEQQRRLPSVVPADVTGSFAAVTALIRAGHCRIAHLGGEDWGEAARDRAKGYKQALATADIAFDRDLFIPGTWTVGSGREATLRLLDLPDPPTAISCFNDRIAIGCYGALAQRGLRVPDDMSVIGFDNEDLVAHLVPPLSTVELPHDEMARWAVGMLAQQDHRVTRRFKIDCPLVLRDSIASPRASLAVAGTRSVII